MLGGHVKVENLLKQMGDLPPFRTFKPHFYCHGATESHYNCGLFRLDHNTCLVKVRKYILHNIHCAGSYTLKQFYCCFLLQDICGVRYQLSPVAASITGERND